MSECMHLFWFVYPLLTSSPHGSRRGTENFSRFTCVSPDFDWPSDPRLSIPEITPIFPDVFVDLSTVTATSKLTSCTRPLPLTPSLLSLLTSRPGEIMASVVLVFGLSWRQKWSRLTSLGWIRRVRFGPLCFPPCCQDNYYYENILNNVNKL